MSEIKTLNGYSLVDSQAREEVRQLSEEIGNQESEIQTIKEFVGYRVRGKAAGTVVALNDSRNAPLKNAILYGKTVQNGVPTIDAPVDIVSAGESGNTVAVMRVGKNLINDEDFTLTVGGVPAKDIYVNYENGLVKGQTYTISMEATRSSCKTGRLAVIYFEKNAEGEREAKYSYMSGVPGDTKASFTITVENTFLMLYVYIASGTEGDTITVRNIMVEAGRNATEYEAYVPIKFLTPNVTNVFAGIPVSTGGNYTDANGQSWVCDTMEYGRGVWVKRCETIASYSGETIPGEYMSSTGNLTEGAKVVYALETPVETPMTEGDKWVYGTEFTTLFPNTTIWVKGGCDMFIEYEYDESLKGTVAKVESFDPAYWGMTTLYLEGDMTGMTKDDAVELSWKYGDMSGTASVKWQGSSSIMLEKKNYTIVFDQAFEARNGWGAQRKYCFKANFVDASHARNVCSARLWGQVVKSRKNAPDWLTALPNGGAIDGFPCVIMLNGGFHGLYTWNIPKDGWMFGFDGTEPKGAILCADNSSSDATHFRGEATELDAEYSYEYSTSEDDKDWIIPSLNRLINACVNSDGTDLDTTIAQYLDWESAIDHYIFTVLISGHDGVNRNHLLVTRDGVKWYFSEYDLDETFGNYLAGSQMKAYFTPSFETMAVQHRVCELIKTYKASELKARYEQLRSNCMNDFNVPAEFGKFIIPIPAEAYRADSKRWPMIPGTAVSNFAQIDNFYSRVTRRADKWMDSFNAESTFWKATKNRGSVIPAPG